MIITRTPYRLSFFGGGTDYATWSERYGGAVVGCAINKYCFITYRRMPPFFQHRNRIVYSSTEYTDTLEDIKHPGAREALRYMRADNGIEIHHTGDLPARSGTGSSSAFIVGLLNAIYAASGKGETPRRLAVSAYHVESQMAAEVVGYQDQVLTAYGGFQHIKFFGHEFEVADAGLTTARIEELFKHVILAFTGHTRLSSPIAASYIMKQDERRAETHRTQEMVAEALAILRGRSDLHALGGLLHESWVLKKRRGNGVSTPEIDGIYDTALNAGATGGKIIGAGGAGFMMLFIDPERRRQVTTVIEKAGCTVVDIDYAPHGTQIIYNDEITIQKAPCS